MTVSLCLFSSGSSTRGKLRALEGCCVSSKSPWRVPRQRRGNYLGGMEDKSVSCRQGIIDLTSRQINVSVQKMKQKILSSWPDLRTTSIIMSQLMWRWSPAKSCRAWINSILVRSSLTSTSKCISLKSDSKFFLSHAEPILSSRMLFWYLLWSLNSIKLLIFVIVQRPRFFLQKYIQSTTRITDFLVVGKSSVILIKWPKIH